jgi:hypothetical protein
MFIEFTFRHIMFVFKFFNLIIADGATCRFDKPGINGDAFINSQALLFKLTEDFRIDLIHGIFRQSFSEARESRMIRRGIAKRNTQKLFE